MSNSHLPIELVFLILSFLPVKTLIRFKNVCKSWFSLISDPHFIKSHHHRASSRNQSLILQAIREWEDTYTHLRFDSSIQTTLTPTNQLSPFSNNLDLVGSINGLVCLEARNLVTLLWNPATRRHTSINFRPKNRDILTIPFVGFGYDWASDDFKIIRIFSFGNDLPGLFMYSCNYKSWQEIYCPCDMPFDHYDETVSVTIKGNPYWMRYNLKPESQVEVSDDENGSEDDGDTDFYTPFCFTFVVQNKVYNSLDLPKYESNCDTDKCLANLRDSLAYMILSPGSKPNKLLHVHVFDHICGAWNKVYTIGPIELQVQRVLHCFKSGEIVIADSEHQVFMYEPASKAVKDLRDCQVNLFLCDSMKTPLKDPQDAHTIEMHHSGANIIKRYGSAACYTESLYYY